MFVGWNYFSCVLLTSEGFPGIRSGGVEGEEERKDLRCEQDCFFSPFFRLMFIMYV